LDWLLPVQPGWHSYHTLFISIESEFQHLTTRSRSVEVFAFHILLDYISFLDRKQKQERTKGAKLNAMNIDFPDPRSSAANQTFLFEQISMGEAMLENGRFEEAVIHLSNAAIASGQPAELLQIFQQTIPSELFVQVCFLSL
jgi:hypothetical protein